MTAKKKRGVNGYVLVCPSRTTRGQYKWLTKFDTPLAEFPEWAKRVGVKAKKENKALENNVCRKYKIKGSQKVLFSLISQFSTDEDENE